MWKRHLVHLVGKCLINNPRTNLKSENIRQKKIFSLVLVVDFNILNLSEKKTKQKQIIGFPDNPIPLLRKVGFQPFCEILAESWQVFGRILGG